MERSVWLSDAVIQDCGKDFFSEGLWEEKRGAHREGMWDIFLDYLFPKHSITGVPGVWITDEERKALRSFPIRIEESVLRSRGVRFLDRIVAASTYDHSPYLRSALHRFKYGRVRVMAEDLGLLLVRAYPLLVEHPDAVVCPVPLHWMRTARRGFNQSYLLANVVARCTHVPVCNLLRRIHPTGHQAWRLRHERRAAMEGAFTLVKPVPASVILVDDIATSGATLDACAKVLREAGAEHVQALVVAYA